MANIAFSEKDSQDPYFAKVRSFSRVKNTFYVFLSIIVSFGLSIMIIFLFLQRDDCKKEWNCPNKAEPRCKECFFLHQFFSNKKKIIFFLTFLGLELCPMTPDYYLNKISALLLIIVVLYQ